MVLLIKGLFLLVAKSVNKSKFVGFINDGHMAVTWNVDAIELVVERPPFLGGESVVDRNHSDS